MRLLVCESQVLILEELQRANTVAYFRTDVNNPLARFALHAPLAGILRGLTRDGVPVVTGTKVIEVDPRRAGNPVVLDANVPLPNQKGIILTFASLFPNSADPDHGIFVYQRSAHLAKRPGNEVEVVAPIPYLPRWVKTRRWQTSLPSWPLCSERRKECGTNLCNREESAECDRANQWSPAVRA